MKGHYLSYYTPRVFFGVHHTLMIADRPIMFAAKVYPRATKFPVILGLCRHSPQCYGGGTKYQWVVKISDFSA